MRKLSCLLILSTLLFSCSVFKTSNKNRAVIKAIKAAYSYKNFNQEICFKWQNNYYYVNSKTKKSNKIVSYPKKAYISNYDSVFVNINAKYKNEILLQLLIQDALKDNKISNLGNIFKLEANAMANFVKTQTDSLFYEWQYLKAYRQRYVSNKSIFSFLQNGNFYAEYIKKNGNYGIELYKLLTSNNYKFNLMAIGMLTYNFPTFINGKWNIDYIALNQKAFEPKKLKKILLAKGVKMPVIFDLKYDEAIKTLNSKLIKNGVDENWLWNNLCNPNFKLYTNMPKYFTNLSEHKVVRKEKTIKWYMQHHGVDKKAINGLKFAKKYKSTLNKIKPAFGFDYHIVVAILGMETNFAQKRYKGKFSVFGALVSQYLLVEKRKNFALKNLTALYKFAKKTNKDIYYYVGSFAGACGYGQFIPTSLMAFFIDENFVDTNIDVYSVEDNIISIANYLHQHGLNAKTNLNEDKNYKAVYAYNHSKAYAKAVLYIKNKLKNEDKK